jgi:hypothetical protein
VASLELRNQVFRIVFRHAGRKYGWSLETGDEVTARGFLGGVEKTLMLIHQGVQSLPDATDVVTFVKYGGRPPENKEAQKEPQLKQAEEPAGAKPCRLIEFQHSYIEARSGDSMKANSLATARMHLNHFVRTLGRDLPRSVSHDHSFVSLRGCARCGNIPAP